ncbi:hypothetical protein GS491_23560 [Rhodococcus hoagii]|nr:hypothetical protein [Prescottella equi]
MTEIQVFTDSQLAHRVVMLKALADPSTASSGTRRASWRSGWRAVIG